jgi:hypothetical protein
MGVYPSRVTKIILIVKINKAKIHNRLSLSYRCPKMEEFKKVEVGSTLLLHHDRRFDQFTFLQIKVQRTDNGLQNLDITSG